MKRKYRIRHETRYEYAADVVHSHHLLHLVPRPARYQECLEHEIDVLPRAAVHAATTQPWEKVRDSFAYHGAWPSRDQLEAARFRHESPHVRLKQAFTDYSADCFGPGRPILACAEALTHKLRADI